MHNINIRLVFVIFVVFKYVYSLENIWHSYHHDPDHHIREELVIANITTDDDFKLEYHVIKWKSLRVEKTYYAAGLTERNVVIASIKLDSEKNKFTQESYVIELEEKPVDLELFELWNSTLQKSETILVIATNKNELLWFRIEDSTYSLFWSWHLQKNVSHISIFQIDYNHHIFVVTTFLNQTFGDLYEFEFKGKQNFWLRQKIDLQDPPKSSTFVNSGPDYFLAVPQQSLKSVLVYKLQREHFVSFKNITSDGITQVISFKFGHKTFLSINGLDAGIYRFTKNDLVAESVDNSHLDGVNYWLPIPINIYGTETILIAQRSLDHGFHKSFVIEMITYDGKKFHEHEDIRCYYLGQEILGSSCLVGEGSKKGIMGATSIYIDDVLALLVPRSQDFSELFLINTEIQTIPNPVVKQLEEFIKQKETLGELMAIQEKRYEEIVERNREDFDLNSLKATLEEMQESLSSMKEKIHFLSKENHFTTIIFNQPVEIQEGIFKEVEVDTIEGQPADEIFADIVLKDNINIIPSHKIFKHLEVENLFFESVNEINAEDLLFEISDNIVINDDLTFENTLTVSGNISADVVNDLIVENEVVDVNSPNEDLVFENVEVLGNAEVDQLINFPLPSENKLKIDSIFIPNNVEVINVNGENFHEFLMQVCLRNLKNYIPGTFAVKGNVTITGNTKTDYLNDLKFPEEYVFKDDPSPNITGKKYFDNTLTTSELKCEGTVNSINVSKIITLSTDQHIIGKTTFKNLKVTESLKVEGNVLGEDANKFLPNPTLLEENNIKANVYFKNLTVEGNIILSENYNNKNFEFLLSDIVYSSEEEAVIDAVKQFPEGFKVENLTVTSNSIGDVDIDSIVTKNTDQILNFTTLHGTVDFENIDLSGLYDFVDIKKLDEETIKLDGEQYISSTLIVENEIEVNKLEIINSINGLEKDQFSVKSSKEDFGIILAEEVTVEGNVWGNIDGFDLADFDKNRLSLSQKQTVKANYTIQVLTVKDLEVEKINNAEFFQFTRQSFEDSMKKKLLEGRLRVENMYVNGPLEIENVNGQSTINMGGSLWINDIKKYKITNLTFLEETFFNTVEIENLSGESFKRWTTNMVFKNETNPKIKGVKTFLQGFSVKNLIETEKLNGILLSNILTKQGAQEIEGSLTIEGDVSFNNVTVVEKINDMNVDLITDSYQVRDDEYKVNGDVLFSRVAHIHNLKLQGYVDDKFAKDFTNVIIYKDEDFNISGHITFENDVTMEKNIRVVGKTNDVDLAAFVSGVVMTTKDAEIKAPTRFQKAVTVKELLSVSNNLETMKLDGVDLSTWSDNAIFVNKGYLEGKYVFEEAEIIDDLHTEFINNINTNTLIPLRTVQNLPEMNFEQIETFKDISVGNSTNCYNLSTEFANTVLASLEQEIDSDIEFAGNVIIEGDMELAGLLNGMEVDKIVTTNTDQELRAIYNFRSKVILERNLLVEKLVNGINITRWLIEGVKVKTATPENITHEWIVQDELILEEEATGNALINGLNLPAFQQEIEDKRNYKYAIEKGFIDDHANICKDLSYMYDKLKKQIYKFNYLEKLQALEFKNKIQNVYHFNHRNNFYLLVNEEKSCKSHLFIFNEQFQFVRSVDFGIVSQIISVRDADALYFVVKNEKLRFCDAEGTNVWQFSNDNVAHLLVTEDQDFLQESLIPGTFYGIKGYTITEFKILSDLEPRLRKYRKWEVEEDNMAFVPRGLSIGLALRTGRKLIRLNREEPIVDDFNYDMETVIRGDYTEESNTYLPGRKPSDLVVMKVGVGGGKRSLLAVASHEETSVKGSLDFIKIYEDVIEGKLFHKVATYKPSSLVALDFDNGETLLAFLEDERVLQVYEYKGIEGFKHKLAVKVEGSKLVALATEEAGKRRVAMLGLIDRNRITFMEAVMLGDKIEDNLYCYL